ncbi:MAG: flippase-like domain-containing protein [Endomicrobium sp.]|jgi:uncharacterized protein (TIRG00374 family)|nr:flippase-like domain-containing protein [Endomicrobium sp.]
MFKKHFVKIFLGVLFSTILIYLTLRQIDFRNSLDFIKNTNYFILLAGILIYAFTYILRSIRYYFIILPVKKTRIMENFPYTMLGFFANNIIPLRLGELIRAKITGERLCISRSSVLATIVIERLFDIVMFILFFFTIMIYMSFPEFIKKSFSFLVIIFIICLVVLYMMLINENKALNFLSKIHIPAIMKSLITEFFNKFTSGLVILRTPSVLIKSFITSIVIWVLEALCLLLVAASCGVDISLLGAVFTVIIIGIGAIIPTAPGYLGAFEFMGVTALSILSIDKNAAFVCIALYHFIQLIVIFALGFACVIKAKLSFSDLFKFTRGKGNQ